MVKAYKPSRDLCKIALYYRTLSPSRLARTIFRDFNVKVTKQAVSVWFKRHAKEYEELKAKIPTFTKHSKHLRFELTTKEYSDFWYIASLLELTKKKDVLLKMMDETRKMKEKEAPQ